MSAVAQDVPVVAYPVLGISGRLENAVLAFVFGLAIALPLAEIVLRATLHVGIEGVAPLVQNLTLVDGDSRAEDEYDGGGAVSTNTARYIG